MLVHWAMAYQASTLFKAKDLEPPVRG
jgi:hypothetical protein